MKRFNVKYSKGHLIDTSTKKRIFLKRGGMFNISGDDNCFEEKDDLAIEQKSLDSIAKLESLKYKYNKYHIEKITAEGQEYFYRFGLSKKTSEDKVREYCFNAIILEDLYLRSKNGSDWLLCECLCKTTECIDGGMQLFEPVVGSSLNNLYANLITSYFPMQRSSTCSVYNTFFLLEKNSNSKFDDKKTSMKFIGMIRDRTKNNFKKSKI